MITLRKAAQQALEALMDAQRHNYALKHKETGDLITTLSAALADPAQEPVAWMYTGIKSDGSEHGPHLVWRPEYMDAMSASKGTKATPLYTSPPQREPLTDEQISDLWHQSGEQPFKFARMLLK